MHMQPIYRMNPFITRIGNGRARTNAYIAGAACQDQLPLDIGMIYSTEGVVLNKLNEVRDYLWEMH